jgi:PAS domain S-box-containing protein
MINKIQSFWQRINDFRSASSDDARRGRLLNILLGGTLILGVVVLISVLVLFTINSAWDRPGNNLILLTLGIVIVSTLGLFIVNQYSVTWASFLFLLVLTLASTFSDTPSELANGRSSFIFFVPVAISSLLLRPVSSFFFALGNSVIIAILGSTAGVSLNVPIIAGLFFLALIAWLSSRSLEEALKDLRVINTNLDQLVTERTQALSEVLTRERIESGRNQAILSSIADGVIVFDSNNVSILANPALSHLMNTNLQNLIGVDFNKFVSAEQISPFSREMMMDLIKNPEKNTGALRIDWGHRTFSTSMARVQTSDNEKIGTVTVFRDITQEAQLEKMKDNFVAVVSHELRTPLNAIMGHAEIMKESVYGTLNEKQASITERIMVNVTRLLSLVGDLLDEAQIRAGKLTIRPELIKTSTLLETLHASMDKITADKGLSLVSELSPSMPEQIAGDPQRIQQILINLVGNALKFTEKGSITVRIDRADSNQWKMEVSDQGIGISEDELPYIFDTFRQANNLEISTRMHGGVGLGLSIVKQLVELMGGEIYARSESGQGSTFTVTLPLSTSSI